MADIVQHSIIQALAWALVHFLWQGAAIGLASFIAFRLVRSASLRYAIGVGALVAMIAAPVTTLAVLSRESAVRAAVSTPSDLRIAVLAWLGGVAFFGIRLIGGWVVARRLTRRAVQPAAEHIQAVARQMADRLAINRAVTILQSSAVVVPVMVGWLKPAVILPVAALAGLSPSQMEALLAHELAHVRRQDYLVNLLQSVAEALLFYNPAVWWLSHRIRADRELCCDDLAVSVCDPLVYATALTDLAAMTSPGVALAATDGDLLGRIRRILGQADVAPAMRAGAMPLLALVLVAGVAVPVALASTQTAVVVRPAEVVVSEVPKEVKPEPAASAVLERQVVVRREVPQEVAVTVEREGRPVTVTIEQTSQQQTEQQRAEEAKREEIRRQLLELQRALAQLDVARAETGTRMAEAQKVSEARVHEAEMVEAKRRLETVKRQFEAGLASEAQLNDAKAAVMKLQAAGNSEAQQQIELQIALEKLERSRQLVEKGLISKQELAAQEQKLMLLEKIKERPSTAKSASAKELNDLLLQKKITITEQAAAKEQLMRELESRSERVREVAAEGQPVAANEPVKAGDYLRINIDGEDIRMNYRVGDEGTIKMPLIGPIKVVGLTAAQVRDAIGKQLVAHKLKTADQVKVTLTRPK
jgi:beta-lactamase regulating signal transducer with metallopeptidase domain